MAGMAKLLELAGISLGGWTYLEMAGSGWNGWK